MPLPERSICSNKAAVFSGKYRHVINIGIQNMLVYRVNFLFRAAFGFIPLMGTIFLWKAIYGGKEDGSNVAGYSLAGMVSYYLLVTIVDALTAVNEDDWAIAADIREGNINQFLLKPIDYLYYRLCLFLAGRMIYVVMAAIPVGLFIWLQREYFVGPPDWATFAIFLLSIVFTALLQFFMSYTMALLAFWVLEVSTFIFIVFAFEYIAGGHLFPLDILPPWLNTLLHWTPFPVPTLFPGQRLSWADQRRGTLDRPRRARSLGGRHLRDCQVGLEPGHPQIHRFRWLKYIRLFRRGVRGGSVGLHRQPQPIHPLNEQL